MCIAGLGIIGVVASAAGSIMSGMAAAQAAQAQAQIAQNNATIAQANAQQVSMAAQVKEQDIGMAGREQSAKIKTAFAANNIDVNSGSAAQVQASQNELNVNSEQRTAAVGAFQTWAYQAQATQYQNMAQMYENQSKFDVMGAAIGGFGSLVGGMGKITSGGDSFPGFMNLG